MSRIRRIFRTITEKPLERSVVIYDDRVEWRQQGILHRENGPAVERRDGTKEWWVNGLRHRDDGPAIERSCGCSAWYQRGILMEAEGEDGSKVRPIKGETPPGIRRCKFK